MTPFVPTLLEHRATGSGQARLCRDRSRAEQSEHGEDPPLAR
jgi:hypothetical protein